MNGLIGLVLVLAAAAGVFFAFRSPGFVAGLIGIAMQAMLPSIKKAVKPKDFTPEQLEKNRRAENPFDTRPPGAGGGNR